MAPDTNSRAAFDDDLDDDTGCGSHMLAGIFAVSKSPLDEGEQAARGLYQRSSAVAILNIGGMRFEQEGASVGVDESRRESVESVTSRIAPNA
jgi:hypothetical protein